MARTPKDTTRTVGPEGQGSPGDVRDRFRDVYSPGAHPAPAPGLSNPFDQIMALFKPKRNPRRGRP